MNKAKSTYHQFWRLSVTAFLAVMLTLAPCSVRNSIEQALGIEKTTVANKSKSAEVKSGFCLAVDIDDHLNFAKANFLSFEASLAEETAIPFSRILTRTRHFSLTSYMGEAVKIPLYILYSSFKYHLSFF